MRNKTEKLSLIVLSTTMILVLALCIYTAQTLTYDKHANPYTWHEAFQYCQSFGKSLVNMKPIYDEMVQNDLIDMEYWRIGRQYVSFWTIHRIKKSSSVRSGTAWFPMDNFLAAEDELDCVSITFDSYSGLLTWESRACNATFMFVCQALFPYSYKGTIDKFYYEEVDWYTARRHCEEQNCLLTTMNSNQYSEYIDLLMFNISPWYQDEYDFVMTWSGYKTLKWVNGYQDWPPTDLTDEEEIDICVVITVRVEGIFWSTASCTEYKTNFICTRPSDLDKEYYFLELKREGHSFSTNPNAKVISSTTASKEECENLCHQQIAYGFECDGFGLILETGTCMTFAMYFLDEDDWFTGDPISNDIISYEVAFTRAANGNVTEDLLLRLERSKQLLSTVANNVQTAIRDLPDQREDQIIDNTLNSGDDDVNIDDDGNEELFQKFKFTDSISMFVIGGAAGLAAMVTMAMLMKMILQNSTQNSSPEVNG